MAPQYAKECSVCNEEYNTVDLVPRCLPCCHSFCSACIQKLIAKNDKSCPFCRKQFKANTACSFGVNRSLLDALELVKKTEEEIERQNEEIERQNELISLMTELFLEGVKGVSGLERKKKALDVESQKMNQMVKQIKTNELNFEHKGTSRQVAFPFGKIEEIQSHINKYVRDTQALMDEGEKIKKMLDKVSETTENKVKVFQDMLNSPMTRTPTYAYLASKLPLKSSQEKLPQQITSEMLYREKETVKGLLKQGRVYSIQYLDGKQRCAKMSIDKKNRLCLHHLKKGALPINAHFIEHRDIMYLLDSSPKLAFLELSDVNKVKLGRIYISLAPNVKYAEQFAMLCTGIAGPTYTNSRILGIQNKGFQMESVHFGNKMGQELIHQVWKEEKEEESPILAGSLQGYLGPYASPQEADQFYIYTKGLSNMTVKNIFGIVEEGLDLLSEITWSQPDIKGVIISDSGLVLSI